MTHKPFNYANHQEANLRNAWTPEFYEGVERMVKEIARVGYQVRMDMQHYVILRRERSPDNAKPLL